MESPLLYHAPEVPRSGIAHDEQLVDMGELAKTWQRKAQLRHQQYDLRGGSTYTSTYSEFASCRYIAIFVLSVNFTKNLELVSHSLNIL